MKQKPENKPAAQAANEQGPVPSRVTLPDAARTWTIPELDVLSSQAVSEPLIVDWRITMYDQIKRIATQDDFPCFFAPKAFASQAPLFLFVESPTSSSSQSTVAETLIGYLNLVQSKSGWQALSTILFIVFKPHTACLSIDEYQLQIWQLLHYLHENDPKEWPADIPTDIDDANWSFCYNGVPMFVNISCPSHKTRRSRNLGDTLVLVMQPRVGFDEIAGNTPLGIQVRKRIRGRLKKYDLITPSPALGSYGSTTNREWAQYGLKDTNNPIPAICPFKKLFSKK